VLREGSGRSRPERAMKILFVTAAKRPDYLNDLVFHGQYSLFGNDVVDSTCLSHMYRQHTPPRVQRKLYYPRSVDIQRESLRLLD
jgi:hypothetical protein